MTETELIQRGWNAKALLESPTWQACFAELDTRWVTSIRRTGALDTDMRESLYAHISALDAIKAQLEAWAHEGDTTEKMLKRKTEDQHG